MSEVLTARDFIEKTLIEEFSDIVNEGKHNYLFFLLISCGIEFLGKCMADEGTDWNHNKPHGEYFKDGLALFPDCYNQNDIPTILYKGLRCGICHALLTGIKVTSTEKQNLDSDTVCLNIHTFFNDFKQACTALIENENYMARLGESFLATSKGSSGTPETIINVIEQE